MGWGTLIVGLYQHGGVTTLVNGSPTPVRFKDAVHHVLRSPAMRNLGTTLRTLLSMDGGWRKAFDAFYSDLDLAGEVRACMRHSTHAPRARARAAHSRRAHARDPIDVLSPARVRPARVCVCVCVCVCACCLLYTSPSPRDATLSRMPSSA